MNIPYRTRRFFRRIGVALMIALMVAVVIWMCWVIWLERYIVYDRSGATLNFDLPDELPVGEVAVPPTEGDSVSVYYNEGDNQISTSHELTQLMGYYADAAALANGIDSVRSQIAALPTSVPIMLDVKNARGQFFYSSSVSTLTDSSIDTAALDQLIADLAKTDRYLIARLPGLRDREFGLNNVDCGLFLPSGIGLWMDEGGCYWLDPTSTGTVTHLIRIVNELKEMGFDEVVFDEFRFPNTDGFTFSGDKQEALASGAEMLVSSCTTDYFAVSFISTGTSFPLPEGRSRLYLTGIDAADVKGLSEDSGFTNPEIRMVFLAESNDTRYVVCGVLRPLDSAY